MPARIQTAGSTRYRYVPGPTPPLASRWWVLARARAVDEITRDAVLQPITVTSTRKDLAPRAASGGLVGLVARPGRDLAGLGLLPALLDLRLQAPGYLPLELAGTLGPIAGFPAAFAPLDFGDVLLRRPGVELTGRVVRNTTAAPPVAGAAVRIDGLWSALPPANWSPPALLEAPNVVGLRPGLYATRPAAATIAHRDLVLSAQAKTLLRPLSAGQPLATLKSSA